MTQPTHVDATFYAQVAPSFSSWQKVDGEPKLESAKVVAITQSKPQKPRSGCVVVKLTIRIPAGAFLPLRPEAVIVIPDDMVMDGQITAAINSILGAP